MSSQAWESCWKPGQDALIVTDVAAQDQKILLAVHQPPVITQMPVPLPGRRHDAAAQASESSQEELYRHLLDGTPREGTLVVPIIGKPGTGKSHIIKWLHAAIPLDSEDLVVRHIPREGTSLPDVVRLLLEGLSGGRFDDLRQSMEHARSNIGSLDQAATRLSLRIAELVQHGVPGGWRRAAGIDETTRDSLCDRSILPAVLTDPVCREHLTRPGGPIYRLAEDIVDGYRRSDDDDEEELGFHNDDLLFEKASLRGAGGLAKRAVSHLRMPGFADAATRILSDALDVASADVIGLSTVSLADVLLDLRAALLDQRKELVILFEDVAIARGLQLDLVDALTTPAIRDGEQRLCALRAALAITPTYWDEQAPETLATRVSSWGGSMFSLDLPTARSHAFAPRLVGRYMNAARVGLEGLRSLESASLLVEVPNACDECPFGRRDECHAVFGASEDGHGLFPLTPASVLTLAGLATDDTFRARSVLSEVVAPVINERAALDAGEFPAEGGALQKLVSAGVDRRLVPEVSLSQLEAIEAAGLQGDDRERALTVLRAWMPEEPRSGAALLAALGLPEQLAEVDRSAAPKPKGTPEAPSIVEPVRGADTGAAVLPPVLEQELGRIEAWASGRTTLPAEVVRPLRRSLFDEVEAGIRWEEVGFGRDAAFRALDIRGTEQVQQNLAVRIERSAGGGPPGSVEPILQAQAERSQRSTAPRLASPKPLRLLDVRRWGRCPGSSTLGRPAVRGGGLQATRNRGVCDAASHRSGTTSRPCDRPADFTWTR